MRIAHRPQMTLGEYYAKCARCPFKDMRAECKRAQELESMPCHPHEPMTIKVMLEQDRELLVKLG